MLRSQWIVGNWKMYGSYTQGILWSRTMCQKVATQSTWPFTMVVCPPAVSLWSMSEVLKDSPIRLGGQDCHFQNQGPFTGEISASMLFDVGCRYVLLGHSERRKVYQESDVLIARKVKAAVAAGLIAILCIGETAAQHQHGLTQEIVAQQIKDSLPNDLSPKSIMIAYEPVWAIGKEESAKPQEIDTVHEYIRTLLQTQFDNNPIPILYGGSVSMENAQKILKLPHVDGVLAGRASLNAETFWQIAIAAS